VGAGPAPLACEAPGPNGLASVRPGAIPPTLYIVMELESWELLDLSGDPLTSLGELRLSWALTAREQGRMPTPAPRPSVRPPVPAWTACPSFGIDAEGLG